MILDSLTIPESTSAKFTFKSFELPKLAFGNNSNFMHDCNRYDSLKLIKSWTWCCILCIWNQWIPQLPVGIIQFQGIWFFILSSNPNACFTVKIIWKTKTCLWWYSKFWFMNAINMILQNSQRIHLGSACLTFETIKVSN